MNNKILSPKSDFIFKLIFGDSRNTDILASFLQAVLDLPEEEYKTLTIEDPHLKKEHQEDKQGILDVKVETASGKKINVEIQIMEIPQMRERIVYYTSKMITGQIGAGDSYAGIKRVVSIVITDYTLIPENTKYHNRYRLFDKATESEFTDVLEIDTLELSKLPENTDNSELWNWLCFLSANGEEELSMLQDRNPQMNKAVGILKELSQDEQTRLLYEAREKARRDDQARYEGAVEKGLQKGLEKGIQKGKESASAEIAKKALTKGLTAEEVADLTGLPVLRIQELAKED